MNFTSYLNVMVLKNLGYQLYQHTIELDVKHSIIKCKLDISENINTADLNYQSVYPEKLNSIGEILDPVSYFGRTRKVVPRLRTSTPVTHIDY